MCKGNSYVNSLALELANNLFYLAEIPPLNCLQIGNNIVLIFKPNFSIDISEVKCIYAECLLRSRLLATISPCGFLHTYLETFDTPFDT